MMLDHFTEGFEARQRGADKDDNPHQRDDAEGHRGGPWRDWDEGWESADDEMPEVSR